MARRELSDVEWELIEPFLSIGRFGPYPERLREQFEGVVWRFRTGSQWREMPREFGAWSTVYERFSQWRDAGVFEALMDSTVVRAHQDAAGMRVGEEVLAALEEAADRTKGDPGKRKRSMPGGTTTPPGSNGVGSGVGAGRG
ncbi:transposase [Streptomyces sp. SID3343]|nr:transposase [Streptomyces sp. SID3343]